MVTPFSGAIQFFLCFSYLLIMIIIGLTGGIASGKSTVAGILAEDKQVVVIDADEIAHSVLVKGSGPYAAAVKEFGRKIVKKDGSIDRDVLGGIIFSDDAARKKLNAITHTAIGLGIAKSVLKALFTGVRYVIIDAPLLLETPAHFICDEVVIVDTTVATQKTRLLARSKNLTEKDADARIAAQNTAEQRQALASKVRSFTLNINNDGDLDDLKRKANSMLRQCKSNSGPLSQGRLQQYLLAIILVPFLIWFFLF
eukprot:TRINITY_DN5879_c0_g1_i1.p1 TRINITY_DN5879_c0_g1~~TRINITY_DN5879_c0_g1_i1.p1  ORF type:complete len:255 (-),score=84.19 TRINITY_DN5879_c0_g1_i1:163-927(-)